MMQPKAPQNSNESGARTTLILERRVSEDKRAHMGHVFLPQNNFSKVFFSNITSYFYMTAYITQI